MQIWSIFKFYTLPRITQFNHKLNIICFRLIGLPVPEIAWEKDGISIVNNPDYLTKFDEGLCSLTIEETFCEDSATFVCRASNSAGSSETSARLIVKESLPEEHLSPPVFITPLSNVSLQEGSKFELKCLVCWIILCRLFIRKKFKLF